jgi:hypothetical protein
MSVQTIIRKFTKVDISTEEIDIKLSSYLKRNINNARIQPESLGYENLNGLKPKDGTFTGYICEQENFRGRYNVCQIPSYFVAIDPGNPDNWKMVHCRNICDKHRKAGVCRRALIKVQYLT